MYLLCSLLRGRKAYYPGQTWEGSDQTEEQLRRKSCWERVQAFEDVLNANGFSLLTNTVEDG